MSTQYDDIGSAYDEMKKLPVAILERENVKAALAPHIHGAKVLDLACGTGYYWAYRGIAPVMRRIVRF